jgi:orotate phosphoribosyltransferase
MNMGGYYICPKDEQGRRLGPLVGYAARDQTGRQLVGDHYVNFAEFETRPIELALIALQLICGIREDRSWRSVLDSVYGFCGAPEGGKALAQQLVLASKTNFRYIYPEKKVIALATEGVREKSELVFQRHTPTPGKSWIIVEDVCNNFSTTNDLISLIESVGAQVAGIVCFLNRSPTIRSSFLGYPVIALVDEAMPEYQQDDEVVSEDVRKGNLISKPKLEWTKLQTAMTKKA